MTALLQGSLENESEVYKAIEAILYLVPERWKSISQYMTDDLSCLNFGHICPVFFTAEPFTETKTERSISRHIPRKVMLQVIARDGHVCKNCMKNIPEDEIEFGHIIPFSRGGPSTTETLRVICKLCNRNKGDSFSEFLITTKLTNGQ